MQTPRKTIDPDERERLLALLENNHTFPGTFYLSVITLNTESVLVDLVRAIEEGLAAPLDPGARQSRESGAGKYASHRFDIPVDSSHAVIALYERVWQVEGVVTVL